MSRKITFQSAKERSDYNKSMVRPRITYGILGFYGFYTLILGGIIVMTDKGLNTELLTIYTGLSTLTASIVSFWFGGRGARKHSGNEPVAPSTDVPVPPVISITDAGQQNQGSEEQSKPHSQVTPNKE